MQNEYIDLPINIQETPKHILERIETYKVPAKPEDASNELLKNLESLLKSSSLDLYYFYQNEMAATYREHFLEKEWLKTSELEELFDTEYKAGAQTIYREFAIRTSWNRTKNQKDQEKYLDSIDEAWEEYTSIFKLEWSRINFPAEIIWDFFDSFLEIYLFHRAKVASSGQSISNDLFNPEETKTMLKEMSATIPLSFNQNPSTKEIFAYYSLIALAVIFASESNFKEALSCISKISLKETSVLSKGMGSLLTTFFIAAFSHFMLEEYYKASKLCETIVPFFYKYRRFFDKSFSFNTQLQPIFEKLVTLHCMSYIFLEEKPKTATMEIFRNTFVKTKEKESRDKISDAFFKMKQNDVTTFWRLFNLLCSDYAIPNIEKSVAEKFKNLQSVNINTIIQNYKRIELEKMAKMLSIDISEVLNKINSLGAVEKTESPWDSTIMNPLLKQKKKVNVIIEGNVANFDAQNIDVEESSREWKRYREEIAELNEKVKVL